MNRRSGIGLKEGGERSQKRRRGRKKKWESLQEVRKKKLGARRKFKIWSGGREKKRGVGVRGWWEKEGWRTKRENKRGEELFPGKEKNF